MVLSAKMIAMMAVMFVILLQRGQAAGNNSNNSQAAVNNSQAVCESSVCGPQYGFGWVLKNTFASLTCASVNCTSSDQSTCCESDGSNCTVPEVSHGVVSGTGCAAGTTVVHGTTCTVKAEAGYECATTDMTCTGGNMTAPSCKLNEKYDVRVDKTSKDYEYKGSASVTMPEAMVKSPGHVSQVEAAMRSALAKQFDCDQGQVVVTSKQESSTVLLVSFTLVLPRVSSKSTEAKIQALKKDTAGLNLDFAQQLTAKGVDATNIKISSFKMSKVAVSAYVSTSPRPVLGSVTSLAVLWVMLW